MSAIDLLFSPLSILLVAVVAGTTLFLIAGLKALKLRHRGEQDKSEMTKQG